MPPGRSAFSRSRNRQIDWLLHHGPLRPLQAALDAELAAVGAPASPVNYFDLVGLFDLTCHLSVPGLEYPRREQPATVRFVGPLPAPDAASGLPPWWDELTDDRPIVHVTQGTLDNVDPTRLIAPAIRGLAEEPVWVLASTGGRSVQPLRSALGGRLPDNARVGEFLPYDTLLPRVSVMVTNGGFGGVQRALAYGVPLVVAGATEDKPEVAARVAWSGVGRNLHTGRPSPRRVRAAVRTVLGDPRYRCAAARLRQEIAEHGDPVDTIADALGAALGRRVVSRTIGLPA
jgi:UDP:flavonoid glycosyltransferase YjiC (YdhE family)